MNISVKSFYKILTSYIKYYYYLFSLNKIGIKKFMQEKTGANNIELLSEIDESIIGGAIISTADYRLDISLKNRLNKLKGINKE